MATVISVIKIQSFVTFFWTEYETLTHMQVNTMKYTVIPTYRRHNCAVSFVNYLLHRCKILSLYCYLLSVSTEVKERVVL